VKKLTVVCKNITGYWFGGGGVDQRMPNFKWTALYVINLSTQKCNCFQKKDSK